MYHVICPNSHKKLTQSAIWQRWNQFKHFQGQSPSLQEVIWFLFTPIHMEICRSVWTLLNIMKSHLVICSNSLDKLTKSKLGKVGVGSNIA